MKLEEHKKNLDDLINSGVLNKFLMVLEARKAIERTTARLAASNITDEELQTLEKILDKQQFDYNEHRSIAQDDIEFHRTIAMASRNEALYSLYMILSLMGQQSELFEELRKRVHHHYMSDHRAIFDALKNHDPEKAEESITAHLDQLCKNVNTYWHDFQENRKITMEE
jgi:DNA-binding FadR family transcriptional regulator